MDKNKKINSGYKIGTKIYTENLTKCNVSKVKIKSYGYFQVQ